MTEQKKTLSLFLIMTIYVLIAIVGFLIVYIIKSHFMPQQKTPTAVTAQHVAPTAIPGKTKKYKNDSADFSLNYPSDLSVKESSYGFGVSSVELRSADNTDKTYAPNVQMLTVPSSMAKLVGQDFNTYYTMANNTTKVISSPLGKDKTAEAFTKIRNREVNKLRALDYSSVPSPNPDNEDPEIGTFIEAGDTIIIFSSSASDRAALEEILKTFTYPL